MASASDVVEALQPLHEAGIRVRTVTTPAVALSALARLRPPLAAPGAIESYIAFDEQVTCIALVRKGVLLAARELPWGFVDEDYTHREPRSREDITVRLGDAIGGFVSDIGGSRADIGQVCVCGGLAELRSMSASLMERLDVEVEPLDSLFGIDAARLPAPADEFRERSAELRLAWAAAADWPPTINLLRARRRRTSSTWLARAAVIAGTAAGLGGSWWVAERTLRSAPPTRMASTGPARGHGAAPAKPPAARVTPAPATVNKAPAVTPPAVVMNTAPVTPPPPVGVNKAPAATLSPVLVNRPPLVVPPPVAAPRPVAVATEKPAPPPDVAVPFDAVLEAILYSPDRKLAIVDNRIVGVGDEIRGARVTEITAGAVLLRDARGRLRRLTLDAGGR
jgi:hypothetical protein